LSWVLGSDKKDISAIQFIRHTIERLFVNMEVPIANFEMEVEFPKVTIQHDGNINVFYDEGKHALEVHVSDVVPRDILENETRHFFSIPEEESATESKKTDIKPIVIQLGDVGSKMLEMSFMKVIILSEDPLEQSEVYGIKLFVKGVFSATFTFDVEGIGRAEVDDLQYSFDVMRKKTERISNDVVVIYRKIVEDMEGNEKVVERKIKLKNPTDKMIEDLERTQFITGMMKSLGTEIPSEALEQYFDSTREPKFRKKKKNRRRVPSRTYSPETDYGKPIF